PLSPLGPKVDAAYDDTPGIALEFTREEFARRTFFDAVTQTRELLLALIRRRSRHVFQIVHGGSADGARDLRCAVHHGEFEHHAVEFITTDTSASECHREFLTGRSSRSIDYCTLNSPSFRRRRIDFGNAAQAVGFGIMRARNEGAADPGRIPAGDHTKAQRFFGLDVTGREILHQVLSVGPFELCVERAA